MAVLSRQIVIWAGETVIGTANLEDWDRGMGVAGARFLPNENYDPQLHAAILEGMRSPLRPEIQVRIESGLTLPCEFVAITDWAKTAGEEYGREVEVFGLDAEEIFGPVVDIN